MFCTKFNGEIEDDDLFCHKCCSGDPTQKYTDQVVDAIVKGGKTYSFLGREKV